MGSEVDAVFQAIDRWVTGRLIDANTADKLRDEAARHASSGTRRLSQYLIATTAAIALLIASGIFIDWAWPRMDRAAQSGFLGVSGVVVLLLGTRLEGTRRWLPASYLLQTAGLSLLLSAFMYSEQVWQDQSLGGRIVGVLALATPVVLAPRAMRRSVVMPAIHLAMGLAFLAVFIDRATGLSGDTVVWVLDFVLLGSIAVLIQLLRTDPAGVRHPWALNAFVMAMFAGFFLVAWTAIDVLSVTDDVIFALDAWLALTVALTLWGRHGAPPDLRREWFGQLLAAQAAVWIPFGFFTAYEAVGLPDEELSLLLVGGAGVIGFLYGNREGLRTLMGVSTLSFVLALWVWAVDLGGALGAVVALLATAGLLFWVSGKIGEVDTAGPSPTAG